VYFVSDVVDQLDLSAIHAVYEKEKRGQPPYDPCLMTKLLVFGYCSGVFSSRRIQKRLRKTSRSSAGGGNEPDFRTISDFRKIHIEALENLFEQVLAMALECGAIKLGRVSLDGTKLKANASKHKAMSYGRMKEKQQQLKEEVKQLLAAAEAATKRKTASTAASAATSCRRNCGGARLGCQDQGSQESPGATSADKAAAEGKSAAEAKPEDKDQYNFTDPESRIMKGADGMVQGYNAQAAVEPELLLIVGQSVTEAANDKQQLVPMVELIEQQSGSVRSGFGRQRILFGGEPGAPGIGRATGRRIEGSSRPASKAWRTSIAGQAWTLAERRDEGDRMKRKLQTKVGKAVYAARKCVVEPVFGQIKQARGFRQFLLRGKRK